MDSVGKHENAAEGLQFSAQSSIFKERNVGKTAHALEELASDHQSLVAVSKSQPTNPRTSPSVEAAEMPVVHSMTLAETRGGHSRPTKIPRCLAERLRSEHTIGVKEAKPLTASLGSTRIHLPSPAWRGHKNTVRASNSYLVSGVLAATIHHNDFACTVPSRRFDRRR
jgi:hypothetical protein